MTAPLPLVRLLHLASPALPVGAYAFSRGLEWAVAAGWITDEDSLGGWIIGLLERSLACLDVPFLARMHAAFDMGDDTKALYENAALYAFRESAEARLEDRRTGQALAKLLVELGLDRAGPLMRANDATFACAFALAASSWGIGAREACSAYVFAWAENQVAAALKLGVCGQSAGQRILFRAGALIPSAVETGIELDPDRIGSFAPGQAMAQALHETMETRLFRS